MADFYLTGYIGENSATVDRLGEFLTANPDAATVIVNSPGGSATEGAAMLAQLEAHGNVTVRVVGVAASAASLVAMGGNRIVMHPAAAMMIHDPACMVFGAAKDLRTEADNLDKLAGIYAAAYARATGNRVEHVRAWMDAETWLTAEEALALHFCDEIEASGARGKPVAAHDYTSFKAAPRQLVRLAIKNGWATVSPGDSKGKADETAS